LVTDPDGEFAAATLDEFRIEAGRVFDELGRTGRAGPVLSGLAVSNANVRHATLQGSDESTGVYPST